MIPFGGNYGDYYNYYNSFYNPYTGALDAVLGVLSSLVLASLLIAVVMFVFESIALYTLAKKRGIKNAFLAFIPVADSYILGKIYDDISATMNKKTSYAVRMVVLASVALVSGVFACVFFGNVRCNRFCRRRGGYVYFYGRAVFARADWLYCCFADIYAYFSVCGLQGIRAVQCGTVSCAFSDYTRYDAVFAFFDTQ